MTAVPHDDRHETPVHAVPPAAATPPTPRAGEQGAWAWAPDGLKQKLRAEMRTEAQAGEPSPAYRFGFGAIGLGEVLGLSPNRKMEKLESTQDSLSHRVQMLEASKLTPKRQRRKQKFGGRGKKKDNDYWLDRWEKDVLAELKKGGCPRKEALDKLNERVRGLGSVRAAKSINQRYRAENGGKDVVSASSLRRRNPPSVTTNSRGEQVRLKSSYICKRWEQWAPYRKEERADDSLAAGSTKMPLPKDDAPCSPAADRSVATAAERPDTNEGEDDRKRSLFDGGLETATIMDTANEALGEGKLTPHEGGQGVTHVRPPENDLEALEDRQEQAATAFLRANGLKPNEVPWQPVRRGSAEPPN